MKVNSAAVASNSTRNDEIRNRFTYKPKELNFDMSDDFEAYSRTLDDVGMFPSIYIL